MASYGIHKLGRSRLSLASPFDDRMMGIGSTGSLALSLTGAYFGGLLLLALLFSSALLTDPIFQTVVVTFVILGVLMFFLPLNSLHAKMEAEKLLYQNRLAQVYSPFQNLTGGGSVEAGNLGPLNSDGASNRLVKLKEFEIAEKRLTSVPTWPLDVQVVSRFIIIVLSVTAALIASVLTSLLHI